MKTYKYYFINIIKCKVGLIIISLEVTDVEPENFNFFLVTEIKYIDK